MPVPAPTLPSATGPPDALSNADHHALYKHGAKEIAALNGVALTFMAKWTMAEAGSSCHLHSSV